MVNILALPPEREDEAARVLARAFVSNPLHVQVFGAGAVDANYAFFRIGLSSMKGPKLAAFENTRIVGVVHWVESPRCQFRATEKLRAAPAMVRGFGVRSALKVGRWLHAWSKQDPAETHLHLGPIGVAPEAQGSGVGRMLMEHYCREADRMAAKGYLETDRPSNVDFYRGFGFEVTRTATVERVANYFMLRSASPRT